MNLHNHSHFSDGYMSPEYLVESAIDRKINLFAITDHFLTDQAVSLNWENLESYIEFGEKMKKKF